MGCTTCYYGVPLSHTSRTNSGYNQAHCNTPQKQQQPILDTTDKLSRVHTLAVEQYRSAQEGCVHRNMRCTGTHGWTRYERVGPTEQRLRQAPAKGAPNITTASRSVAAASIAFVYTAIQRFWGGITSQQRWHEQRSAATCSRPDTKALGPNRVCEEPTF